MRCRFDAALPSFVHHLFYLIRDLPETSERLVQSHTTVPTPRHPLLRYNMETPRSSPNTHTDFKPRAQPDFTLHKHPVLSA